MWRKGSEKGSALLLVPVTFLIVVILAIFALNSALTFLAAQELERRASSAANDAVSGLERNGYFDGGGYELDAAASESFASKSGQARTQDSTNTRGVTVVVERTGPTSVRATATGHSVSFFSKLLPWSDDSLSISVEAEAVSQ